MKRIFILLLASAAALHATAQRLSMASVQIDKVKSISVLSEGMNSCPNLFGTDFGKVSTIDTALVTAVYTLHYRYGEKEETTDFVLQASPKHSRCYSASIEHADSLASAADPGTSKLIPVDEVYADRNRGHLTVISRLPMPDNMTMLLTYGEKAPEIAWSPTGLIDTLAGYPCREATADFRGRTWHVWYTEEIPFYTGPWKLSGAPGLILQASSDDDTYRFELQSLRSTREPIFRYDRPTKKTTREKLRNFTEQFYEAPYRFLGDNDTNLYVTRDEEQKLIALDETNWKLFYDPIERE